MPSGDMLLFLGSTPDIAQRSHQVTNFAFTGCIRDVTVNMRPMRLANTANVLDHCPRVESPCSTRPCDGTGAQCIDRWATYACSCADGVIATQCDDGGVEMCATVLHLAASESIRFDTGSFVQYKLSDDARHELQLRQVSTDDFRIEIDVRPTTGDGVIVFAASTGHATLIDMVNSTLRLNFYTENEDPIQVVMKEQLPLSKWSRISLAVNNRGTMVSQFA